MSPAILQISIGILLRCAAKMQFMTGMYWYARSPDTLKTRIRDCKVGRRSGSCASLLMPVLAPLADMPGLESVRSRVWWLVYASARVRAPAIIVVLEAERSASVVLEMRVRRFVIMASSTRRKGRYLFASSEVGGGLRMVLPLGASLLFGPWRVSFFFAGGRSEVPSAISMSSPLAISF